MRSGYVYFIRAANSGLIKIGRAKDPQRRLAALRTGSADVLTVLKIVATDDARQLERDLHRRFAPWRQHGEWFAPNPGLTRMAGHPPRITDDERRALSASADRKMRAWIGAPV